MAVGNSAKDPATRRRPDGSSLSAGLIAILLVAGFLKLNLPWLQAGLWRDEASAVWVASATTLHDFFSRCIGIERSPPLFDGLLALWGRMAGFGEISLAIFAAVLGTAAVAAVAFAASKLAGPWAGFFAILFLLDGDIVFWEFAQVRPYMLSIGAAGVMLASLIGLVQRIQAGERFQRTAITLSASCVVLTFSHYSGTVAVGCTALISIVLLAVGPSRLRAVWRALFLCTMPAAALFLPWLPAFLRQRRMGVTWNLGGAAERARNTADSVLMMLPQFGPHGRPLSYLPAGILIAASLLFWRPVFRQWRSKMVPAVVLCAVSIGILVVMGSAGGASRYLVIVATFAAIVFAVTAVFIGRSLRERGVRPGALTALGLLLAFGPVYGEAYRRSVSGIGEYRPSKSGIRRFAGFSDFDRGALFIAVPSYFAPTLWYYGVPESNLRGFPPIRDLTDTEYSLKAKVWSDPGAVPDFLARIREDVQRRSIGRVIIIWGPNPVPEVARSINSILGGASRMFRLEKQGTFSGYPETIYAAVFAVR